MATQKEMIAEILESQKEQGRLLTDIDNCLRGPDYDPTDGGLVQEVHKNTECISTMKRKQNRIVAWGTMLIAILNAGFFALIAFFKK